MEPMTMALIASAVLGAAKSQEQDFQHKQATKVQAVKERWAPFTGKRGQDLMKPSSIDPMMQALMAGAMIGQGIKNSPASDASGAGGGGGAGDGTMGAVAPLSQSGAYAATPAAAAAQNDRFNPYVQQNYFRPYATGGV